MSQIRMTLVLSTGHVSQPTANLLDASPGTYWEKSLGVTGGHYAEYGWFVYCSPVKPADCPDDLFAVMQYALAKGCEHVLFDRDEAPEPDLPRFDW